MMYSLTLKFITMKKLNEIFGNFGHSAEKKETLTQVSGDAHTHSHVGNSNSKVSYQCPMKCEGSKTYNVAGNCPVCNMKMVPAGDKGSHNHHHCC